MRLGRRLARAGLAIPPKFNLLRAITLTIDEILREAVECHQAGRWQDAERLYRDVLRMEPGHPDANNNLGVLAMQLNQPEASLPHFQAALAANPGQVLYWRSYVNALIGAGQFDLAGKTLELARQHGLQADEAEVLAVRLREAAPPADSPNVGPAASKAPALASDKGKRPAPKPVKADKPGKGPGQKEVNTLLALLKQGRDREAASLARKLTVRFPQHGFGWKFLGVLLRKSGQADEALLPMQKAATLLAEDAGAHFNLGTTLHDLGRFDEAEACYRRALAINPEYAEAHCHLGLLAESHGQAVEAEVCFRRALSARPDYVKAHYQLGLLLLDLERFEEAEASLRRVLALQPDHADAHGSLSNVFRHLNRLDEVEACLRQVLAIQPDSAAAYVNLGNVLRDMNRLSEAEACERRALAIEPGNADAHNNLGTVLTKLGRLEEAIACYRQAIEIEADHAKAWHNMGASFSELNRLDEAEACYRRALEIDPAYASAHGSLAIVLMWLGRTGEAEDSYRRAIKLKPGLASAHSNLGSLIKDSGRFDEAEACYRRALEIKPDYEDAFGNLLFASNYHPDKSAEEIFAVYQEYEARFGLPHRGEWQAHGNRRETSRRLRLGYVSPDFKTHAAQRALEPLLARHDKAQFEIYAYAELAREDEVSARYKQHVDHWIATRGLSDAELAGRIRADEIDILVDLAGHTAGNRLGVFARKPAPVSVSWLGFVYTTGLTAIDYYLTDEIIAPAGSERLFAEKLWRMPAPAGFFRPVEGMGEVNHLPALTAGHVTFGSLSRMVRLNHKVVRVWSEILRQVEGAKLAVDSRDFLGEGNQDWLARQFATYGIGRERLQIGFHTPPWEVLRATDIGLDCFPHNSGTTLVEGLYLGVPQITLADRPSVGRIGSTLINAAGHPEWIAHSEEDYIAKAVDLAGDLGRLSRLRLGLRAEIEKSPLMDEEGFVRRLEQAYRDMWRVWCETGGQP